jgi:hypothetical protein
VNKREPVFAKAMFLALSIFLICGSSSCNRPEQGGGGTPGGGGRHMLAGSCSDTWAEKCVQGTNICPAGNCSVSVVADPNGNASISVQGGPITQYVCAPANTQITWQAPQRSSKPQQFIADFGAASPWITRNNYVVGNTTTPGQDKLTAANPACYKFNLSLCDFVCSGTQCSLTCATPVDPKVIVGN